MTRTSNRTFWTVPSLAGLAMLALATQPLVADPPATQPADRKVGPFVVESAAAATQPADQATRIRFTFNNESLGNVLEFFSRITGLPLVGPQVPGTVTYYSPRAYHNADEAIAALNSILITRDYYVMRQPECLRVMPLSQVKGATLPIYSAGTFETAGLPDSQIVTVVTPAPFNAAQMVAQLKPMVPTFGSIAAMGDGQLVVTADASSIRSIRALLKALEAGPTAGLEFRVFSIRHNSAEQVAHQLNQMTSTPVVSRDSEGRPRVLRQQAGAIMPDSRTNSVMVVAAADTFRLIETMIEKLDCEQPEGMAAAIETKIYTLGETDVQRAAESVRNAFQDQRAYSRDRRSPVAAPDIRVTVDPQHRRLIVTATPQRHADIDKLLKALETDVEGDSLETFKIVPLKHAQANQVAAALRRFIQPRSTTRLDILEDSRGNCLMIQTDSKSLLARAEKLVAELDQPAAPQQASRTIRTVDLLHSSADAVARSINSLLIATGKLGEPRPVIEPNGELRMLMISCTADQWTQIKELVDDIEKVGQDKRTSNAVFALKKVKPTELERVINQFYSQSSGGETGRRKGPVRAIADDSRSLLMVDAPAYLIEEIKALISQLDAADPSGSTETRAYELASGKEARELGETLARALQADQAAGRVKASFQADNFSATLFVTARESDFTVIETTIEKFRARMAAVNATRRFMLRHADGRQVASVLSQAVSGAGAQVVLVPAPDGRYILASGSAGGIELAAKLLADLDKPDPAAAPIRAIVLKSSDPATMAAQLTDLYEEINNRRRAQNKGIVRFRPDLPGGRLFVIADDDAFAEIQTLVADLDKVGQRMGETRLVKLTRSQAANVASVLGSLYAGRQGFADVRIAADTVQNAVVLSALSQRSMAELVKAVASLDGGTAAPDSHTRCYDLGPGVACGELAKALETAFADSIRRQTMIAQFLPEPVSNSLFVTAQPEDFPAIEARIDKLKAAVRSRTAIRRFRITSGNAATMTGVLYSVMSGQSQTRPPYEQLRLSCDAVSNTIIAAGAADLLATVEGLVNDLQAAGPSAEPTIRIVKLSGGDANQLAATIRQTLGQGSANAVKVPGVAARITPEPGSNSLILSGPADEVAAAEKLVSDIEKNVAAASEVRVVELEHAWPADVLAVLNEVYLKRQASGQAGSAMSMAADNAGRKLIVNATDAQFNAVAALIKQLDALPKQAAGTSYIALLKADAATVAAKLAAMAEEKYGKHGPAFEADALSGSIIVTGTLEQRTWAESLVAEIFEPYAEDGPPVREVRVIPLPRTLPADKAAVLAGKHFQLLEGAPVKVIQFGSDDGRDIPIHDLGDPTGGTPATQPERTGLIGGSASRLLPLGHVPQAILACLLSAAPNDATEVIDDPDRRNAKTGPGVRVVGRPATRPDEIAQLPKAPTVFVDPASNSLIVEGTTAQVERIQEIVDSLAQSLAAGEYEIRIFRLTKSSPDTMATMLESLFNDRRTVQVPAQPQPGQQQPGERGSRRGGRDNAQAQPAQPQQRVQIVRRITVVPDLRTSAIIVKASPADFMYVEPLVRSLDVTLPTSVLQVQVFTLKNIDAAEAEKNLKQLFRMMAGGGSSGEKLDALRQQIVQMQRAGRLGPDADVIQFVNPSRMTISANAAANSLVVAAPPEGLALVSQLLSVLDEAPKLAGSEVNVFHLANARAEQLAAVFQNIFRQRQQQRSRPAAAAATMAVSAHAQSNSLVVRAAAVDMEEIRKLIAELDKKELESLTRVYRLRFAEAAALGRALEQIFQRERGSLRIAADPSTNCLVVTASEPDHVRLGELVQGMDVEGRQMEMRVYSLKTAQAEDVARAISNALGGQAGGQGRQRSQSQARVSADGLTNTLVAMATPDEHAQIERIVKQLESGETLGRVFQSYDLKHAGAADVVTAISPLFTSRARAGRSVSRDQGLTLTADHRTNSVLLAGSEPQVKEALELIKDLDREGGQGGLKVYQLKFAEAASLAQTLGAMFRSAGRGSQAAEVRIAADAPTNRLFVTASQADHARIAQIIDEIEQGDGPARRVEAIELKRANAAEVAAALQQLYSAPPAARGRQQPQAAAGGVVISVEPGSNTVMVSGTEQQIKDVAALIAQLDKSERTGGMATRVIRLKNGSAAQLAPMVQRVHDQAIASLSRQGNRNVTRVSVGADSRTNAIVLVGSADQFESLEKLIEQLDIGDGAASFPSAHMIVLPLKHASARNLAAVIPQMLKRDPKQAATPQAASLQEQVRRMKIVTASGKPVSELDLDKPVSITAEEGTNSLIISSSEENVAALAAVVGLMDSLPVIDALTVRIFPIVHADANVLAQSLNDLFTRSRQLVIKPGTNQPAGPRQVAMTTAIGNALANQVIISVDRRTNTVLAAGVEEAIALVEVLVKELDKQAMAGIEVRLVPVRHSDAGVLRPMLADLFDKRLAASLAPGAQPMPSDRVSISAEATTNALVAVGKKDNLDELERLMAKLDIEPQSDSALVRFYPLNHADADTTASLLTTLYKGGVYVPGRVAGGQTRPEDKVTITSDLRTNVVIVSGSKQNLAIIEGLLQTLDRDMPAGVYTDTKIYALDNADATKAASILQQLFDRKRAAAKEIGRSIKPVTIFGDARSNTLIVAGNKEAFADIELLLKTIDQPDAKLSAEFRMFALKFQTAQSLGPMLQDLLNRRRPPASTAQGAGVAPVVPVSIVPDQSTNTLIVMANRDDMTIVEDLVKQLDREQEKLETTRIFPLLSADASSVAATLRQLYSNRPDARSITFSVDSRLNAVVVNAGKNDMDAIGKVIKDLDNTQPNIVKSLKVIPLANAEAANLAKIVADTLRDPTPVGGRASGPRATILKMISQDDRVHQTISTRKEEITVTPDIRTNSVVVSAPAESMDMMVALIGELDKTARVLTQFEIFALENADATQMAEIIKDLFQIGSNNRSHGSDQPLQQFQLQNGSPPAPTAGGGGFGGTLTPGGGGLLTPRGIVQPPGPAAPTAAAPAPALVPPAGPSAPAGNGASSTPPSPYRPELSITVDTRNNYLIASGVPEDLAVVRELIDKLDSSDVVERINRVYALRNAQAEEIQAALDAFLRQETQRRVQLLGQNAGRAAAKAIETEVSVVAVRERNQVLLSASPRYIEQVSQIIAELDQPPPQVLIQVLLAEVTLEDAIDLGFEAKFDAEVTANSKKGTLRTETSFGVAAQQAANGGFAVSLTGTDFEFILRALQSQSRLEVLSRPQILASDNQEAQISVGSRVPVITSTRITELGDSFSTVSYEDVGIILKVTPKINPDGWVNMLINPEISSISASTVQVSPGVALPIFDSRSATTTVMVRDNQTIVIGGLLRTSDQEIQSKVPFLGDLPGPLGLPWRATRTVKQRTELLIVLTPRVLRTSEDAARVSVEERNRISVMPRSAENTELVKIRPPAGPPLRQPIDLNCPPTTMPDVCGNGRSVRIDPAELRATTTRPDNERQMNVRTYRLGPPAGER